MSDAILLVDDQGCIITGNARLGQLLRLSMDQLPGTPYEPTEFWAGLDLIKPDIFGQRMTRATERLDHPVQEQFETRDGAFLFQIIPVLDELQKVIAQLWVVQEISAQVRNRKLLEDQAAQLRALQRIGLRLNTNEDVQGLMRTALIELNHVFDCEAIGLAIRTREPGCRSRQLIWQGGNQTPIPQGTRVVQTVKDTLMPLVLTDKATSLWTDLQQHVEWATPFRDAGIESLAATALHNRDQTQGVLWIGRRAGRRIERYHMYLLEALGPILATALENSYLREQLHQLQLTDMVTDLPCRRMANTLLSRLINRPGHPWALMLIDLDQFQTLNNRYGHAEADRLLKAVADLLRERCRSNDDVIRYDNDQFLVLSSDMEVHEAADLAERIREAIEQLEHTLDGEATHPLTCSIGVVASPTDHTSGALATELALQRLKVAKHKGRNRVETRQSRLESDPATPA